MRYPLWCLNPKYLLKTLQIIMFPQAVKETSNKPLKVWDDKTFCLNHNPPRTNYKKITTLKIIVWIYCYTTEELNFTLTKISIVCIKQIEKVMITRTQYCQIEIFCMYPEYCVIFFSTNRHKIVQIQDKSTCFWEVTKDRRYLINQ